MAYPRAMSFEKSRRSRRPPGSTFGDWDARQMATPFVPFLHSGRASARFPK
jgi:hypothetical protein